jgi:hypothetical protein
MSNNDELTPNDGTLNELSDEELDEVAGGFSLLRISATRFGRSRSSSSRGNRGGRGGFQAESIESAALQITIVDGTADDLKALGSLLRGADAVDDD